MPVMADHRLTAATLERARKMKKLSFDFQCPAISKLIFQDQEAVLTIIQRPMLSRRSALALLAAPGAAAFAGGANSAPLSPADLGGDVCFITPQSIEGPFYFNPALVRAAIAEDRIGVPLRVKLRVIEGGTCMPIAKARVDLWHSDCVGLYSGYRGQGDKTDISTVGKTFLRGTQFTDEGGWVNFETIYPGWYAGRTTHMHFKVFLEERNVLMGQMYFPDAINEYLYQNVAAYKDRPGVRDSYNATDRFGNFGDPGRLTYSTVKEERDRYVASLVLGVDRNVIAKASFPPLSGSRLGPQRSPEERAILSIPGRR
jgi:protocatechuate 3,4-dioxygenase beta subunit